MSTGIDTPAIAEVNALLEADAALLAQIERIGGLDRLAVLHDLAMHSYQGHHQSDLLQELRRWAVAHGLKFSRRPSRDTGR